METIARVLTNDDRRDIFAAAAVSSLRGWTNPENAAEAAYKIADAMMKERERTPCSPPREPK